MICQGVSDKKSNYCVSAQFLVCDFRKIHTLSMDSAAIFGYDIEKPSKEVAGFEKTAPGF